MPPQKTEHMNALKNLNQAFQAPAARTRRGNRAPVSIIVGNDGADWQLRFQVQFLFPK
jgi:hypothetical protein